MLTLQTLWRWVHFPLILITVLVLGLGTWVAWALTDQRYQRFLTQQLSDRLAAEVQIGTSRVTVRQGLGIAFANVTIRDRPDVTPLFTADTIDVFLDFSSLLRGHFDFRRVIISKPTLHVIEGVTQEAIFQRLRRETTQPEPATQESKRWFTPRFTLQQLTVKNGTATYSRDTSTAPLFFTQINATVAYTDREVINTQLETDIGQGGELGTLTLHTRSQEGGARIPFSQRHWQGAVALSETRIQQIGHVVGKSWPRAILGFSGQYDGQWTGPADITGLISLRDMQIGTSYISQGRVRLEKLFWPGLRNQQSAPSWASVMRAVVVNARIKKCGAPWGQPACHSFSNKEQ